jgi:RNA polymerase-binding transcription factor DksA
MAHQSCSTNGYRAILLAIRADLLTSPRLRPDSLAAQHVGEEDLAKMSHDEFVSLRLNHFDYVKLQSVTEALERTSNSTFGLCAGDCPTFR